MLYISASGSGAEPVGSRNAAIRYGLGNLVENAVDFAQSKVEITSIWDDKTVSMTIRDDGPGFALEVLSKIGDPYVTVRGPKSGNTEAGGLGLGFFIAKTLLERTGAKLFIENRPPPEHGAVIRVNWPRAAIEHASKVDGQEISLHKT